MKLLILSSIIYYTVSMEMLGKNECTWGPTHWCKSITQSSKCETTSYCLDYWKKPVRKSNLSDTMCDVCIDVADKAIDEFKGNEGFMKLALLNLCKYCSKQTECESTINDNWEELKNLINDNLNSSVLCSALNMCQQISEPETASYYQRLDTTFTGILMKPSIKEFNDGHLKFTPKVEQALTVGDASKVCNDCMQFVIDLKELAEDENNLKKFVETIQQVCDEIEYRSLCRLALNKKIVKAIIMAVNPQKLCFEVDICEKPDSPVVPKPSNCCTSCDSILADIRQISQTDLNKFTKLIASACNLIPKPVNKMCESKASKFAKEASKSIKEITDKEACNELGLCNAVENINAEENVNSRFQVSDLLAGSHKWCDYCETAVEYIVYAVDSDMTTDQIKQGLEQLCDQLGVPNVVTMCKQFVEKYWTTLVNDIDMILEDPEHVCEKLHFCKKPTNIFLTPNEQTILGQLPPECTYGPQYWCASEENMKKCKAEEYCKKGGELLESIDYCSYGASFWCASEENKKLCKAENFCGDRL